MVFMEFLTNTKPSGLRSREPSKANTMLMPDVGTRSEMEDNTGIVEQGMSEDLTKK